MKLDLSELDKLKLLGAAAGPVPWEYDMADGLILDARCDSVGEMHGADDGDANGALIVAARNALPALVNEIESLREILAQQEHLTLSAQKEVDRFREQVGEARAEVERLKTERLVEHEIEIVRIGEQRERAQSAEAERDSLRHRAVAFEVERGRLRDALSLISAHSCDDTQCRDGHPCDPCLARRALKGEVIS